MQPIHHIHVVEAATREGYERALSEAIHNFQDSGHDVDVQVMVPQVAHALYSALLTARGL